MEKWSSKGKPAEQILEEMERYGGQDLRYNIFDAMNAAIQVRLTAKICGSMDAASTDFVRQSTNLKECVDAARNNFVDESHDFRKSIGEIRSSLEEFRNSSEKSSRALTRATYVLAGVALIQAIIFVLQWLK